jgi:hypothetical protein
MTSSRRCGTSQRAWRDHDDKTAPAEGGNSTGAGVSPRRPATGVAGAVVSVHNREHGCCPCMQILARRGTFVL